MGCASAKHVSTVQNEEEAQKGKNYQNGDVFGDEYRIKPVEEVKYMKNGGEDDQKVAARNQENLEKSASSNVRLKSNKEVPGLVHQPRANMHISESQQEFFRMLDEKIEKNQNFTVAGEFLQANLLEKELASSRIDIAAENLKPNLNKFSLSSLRNAKVKQHRQLKPKILLKKI
ncbi:uncharacterized protein C1orf21 homolog isoform X1 [Trachemys scripta elegans]|uniref:uncharacterized protein C1orf21 homolog isoform X1 n=1 Tax=Trachemys scripta elegans TaxID=31138 RepID=UPI0015577E37|nr:uncharacterized protein C1orf21 homolog isoform X1 [Trachemys scripta elegans]